MRIKIILLLFFLCVTVFFLFLPVRTTLPEKKHPNVVLIILDAMRADYIKKEWNGTPLMPNLSKFSESVIEFDHAISPCTWTKPAIASLFTALPPESHGVHFCIDPADPKKEYDVLPSSLETMAEYFHANGYQTAAIQTNPNLIASAGFSQGFQTYLFKDNARAVWTTNKAIEQIGELQEPYFLYVHYMDPHMPYDPPAEYNLQKYDMTNLKPEELSWIEHFHEHFMDFVLFSLGLSEKRKYPDPSDVVKDIIRSRYAGEVFYLDAQLNRLLQVLDKQKNTIIIITADHGEEFWEHNTIGHGTNLFETTLHVPLLMKIPGILPKSVGTTINTIGLLPTLANIIGLPTIPYWNGQSFFPITADNENIPVFASTRGAWERANINLAQVQQGPLKLIIDRNSGIIHLFNLASDPNEKIDLGPTYPMELRALEKLLSRHIHFCEKWHADHIRDVRVSATKDIQDSLEALGYIGDAVDTNNSNNEEEMRKSTDEIIENSQKVEKYH